jgi:hypothetical protein
MTEKKELPHYKSPSPPKIIALFQERKRRKINSSGSKEKKK